MWLKRLIANGMNKNISYNLKQLIKTIDKDQIIKISSKNIPLFLGTIYEFEKLEHFEYKGLSSINVLILKVITLNSDLCLHIILDFHVDFNKFSKFSPEKE